MVWWGSCIEYVTSGRKKTDCATLPGGAGRTTMRPCALAAVMGVPSGTNVSGAVVPAGPVGWE